MKLVYNLVQLEYVNLAQSCHMVTGPMLKQHACHPAKTMAKHHRPCSKVASSASGSRPKSGCRCSCAHLQRLTQLQSGGLLHLAPLQRRMVNTGVQIAAQSPNTACRLEQQGNPPWCPMEDSWQRASRLGDMALHHCPSTLLGAGQRLTA